MIHAKFSATPQEWKLNFTSPTAIPLSDVANMAKLIGKENSRPTGALPSVVVPRIHVNHHSRSIY